MEVQATEREQERDEAQKEIEKLEEQLRDREKDRASCERINKEVGFKIFIDFVFKACFALLIIYFVH